MKKVFALMKGEKILDRSEKYSELIPERDKTKDSYICTYLGRINLNDFKEEPEAEINEDENNNQLLIFNQQ